MNTRPDWTKRPEWYLVFSRGSQEAGEIGPVMLWGWWRQRKAEIQRQNVNAGAVAPNKKTGCGLLKAQLPQSIAPDKRTVISGKIYTEKQVQVASTKWLLIAYCTYCLMSYIVAICQPIVGSLSIPTAGPRRILRHRTMLFDRQWTRRVLECTSLALSDHRCVIRET